MRKTVVTVVTVNFKKIGNLTKNGGDSGDRPKNGRCHQGVTNRVVTPSVPIYLDNQGFLGVSPLFSNIYTHYRKKSFLNSLFVFSICTKNSGDSGDSGDTPKNLAISPSGVTNAVTTSLFAVVTGGSLHNVK